MAYPATIAKTLFLINFQFTQGHPLLTGISRSFFGHTESVGPPFADLDLSLFGYGHADPVPPPAQVPDQPGESTMGWPGFASIVIS